MATPASPYDRGWMDFFDVCSIDQNPYDAGTVSHQLWDEGWHDASETDEDYQDMK